MPEYSSRKQWTLFFFFLKQWTFLFRKYYDQISGAKVIFRKLVMIFLYKEAHEATNATQRMMTFQFTMKSKLPQQVVT